MLVCDFKSIWTLASLLAYWASLYMSVFSVPQTPMKKTRALIGDAGATFVNAVSTFTQQHKK